MSKSKVLAGAGVTAALMAATFAGLIGATRPAAAQSAVCQQFVGIMQERQALMQRINGMGRRNVDPAAACQLFGRLASNGTRAIAFLKENKDWCQIPDEFANNLTSSQQQVSNVRAQACRAANQRAQLQRQARQQAQRQQQEGQGSFGGVDGFGAGPWRVPQGAL
jgi:hypothetical protein